MPLNARPGDHLVMGNHRAQYTRSGWALLEQRASLNLPLGPVRRGKVSRFLVKITAGRASERYPECRNETARVLVPDSDRCPRPRGAQGQRGERREIEGASGQGHFGTRLGIDFREPPIADSLNLSMLPDASGR
jgi:hypothetical protein